MPRPCLVCNSPARAAIEAGIIAGEKHSELEKQFGIERRSITRHKANHMDKPVPYPQNGELQALELTGEPENDIKLLLQEAAQILAEARAKASTDTQIKAADMAGRLIEKAAKIFGKIADQTVEVKFLNIQVIADEQCEHGQIEQGPVGLLE